MSLTTRSNFRRVFSIARCRRSVRAYCDKPDKEKPIKFTTSAAADWRAEFTRSGEVHDDSPDAQPFIVSLSTAVFLWYFLWYREESDLDDKFDIFDNNLYTRVEGLEEVQLRLVRENKLKRGEDTRDIDKRLHELETLRLQESG